LDAVPGDTPASRATSVIVAWPRPPLPRTAPTAAPGGGSTVFAVFSLPELIQGRITCENNLGNVCGRSIDPLGLLS
jgi:hypothetical protein